jgi:hypothetical protein
MFCGDDRPMSEPSSRLGATFSARARVASSLISRSPASPTATTAEIAMQRSPAEPYAAPMMASAANPMSASGMTTAWFFAPPSACTRLPAAAAVV